MSFCENCANAVRPRVKPWPEVKCRSQIVVCDDLRRLFGGTVSPFYWSRSQRACPFCCKITRFARRSSCPRSCSVHGTAARDRACSRCCSQPYPLIFSFSNRDSPFHLVCATGSISPFFFFQRY